MSLRRFCLVLLVLVSFPLSAEQNTNPQINQHYQNPDVGEWRGVFERDGREIWDRRHDILKALNLKSGMRVADVGTGTGFLALMMAEKVGPEGRVYAVDIAKNFVDGVMERWSVRSRPTFRTWSVL